MSTGWMIGYIIGGIVVLLVVALLLVLIATARKIASQAREIQSALETARTRTLALWEIQTVNQHISSITDRLGAVRSVLGGRR